MFWQIQAIIRDNEVLAAGGAFHQWLSGRYVDSVTSALRRLADQRRDVESLWRLLEAMKPVAPMLTKARYVALHDDDPHFRRSAAEYWDRAIAPGHDAIPRALIVGKQDELRRGLEHVARYASEHGRPYRRSASRRDDDVRGCPEGDGHSLQDLSMVRDGAAGREASDAGPIDPRSVASGVPRAVARAGAAGACSATITSAAHM